jgi:thiol:disulfide interchange protein
MKTVKTALASIALVLLVSVAAFAGNKAKVIAVVNKADWCPVCQKNGMRAMDAFKANNKDMSIQFVANDLTNDETKAKSAEELKKLGLDKAIKNYPGTGVTYFFNSETKALISQISVAKTDQELAAALETAKKSLK